MKKVGRPKGKVKSEVSGVHTVHLTLNQVSMVRDIKNLELATNALNGELSNIAHSITQSFFDVQKKANSPRPSY